jgi:predicted aldo/keto reductase-like oxidoreductase
MLQKVKRRKNPSELYLGEVSDKIIIMDLEKEPRGEFCEECYDFVDNLEDHVSEFHNCECMKCHQTFPNPKILEVHVLEYHDTMFAFLAKKQNMYQCVSDCSQLFPTRIARNDHLIHQHFWSTEKIAKYSL